MTATAAGTTAHTTGLTVRLPTELAEVLKNYAFVTDISGNEVIKRALIAYLKTHGRDDLMKSAFDRVVAQHKVALDKMADMVNHT
jgi:hypothetical protein